MTDGQPKRKIAVNQLDEIWKVAADRWGDPGRRTPAPDPRFEQLRRHLNNIETLFGQNVPEAPPHPALRHAQQKGNYSGNRKIGESTQVAPAGFPTNNIFGESVPAMQLDGLTDEELEAL